MNVLGFGIVNASSSISPDELALMVAALELQLQGDAAPIWNTPADLQVKAFDALTGVPDGWWTLMLSDTVSQPNDYGYHTSLSGNVYSEIEVPVILGAGGNVLDASQGLPSVSTVASHEMLETLMDSQVTLWIPYGPQEGQVVAYEVADPVQGNFYLLQARGSNSPVWVSNFITPRWFDEEATLGPGFDRMGILSGPFTLGAGGYVVLQDSAGNFQDVWGDRKPALWGLRSGTRRDRRHRLAG